MESSERPPETPLMILLVVLLICASIGMFLAATTKAVEIISEAIEKLKQTLRNQYEEGYIPRAIQKILHLLNPRMDRKNIHAG